MRLGEAREVLGLTADSSPEDARRAYRRLALTAHPDKNASPDATERFQRIQDAFTRIQASEESGRGGGSDDDDEDDDEYDDEYYDEYEAFEEAAFMFMYAFGGGPPPGFGGQFGGGGGPPRGFGGFSHPASEQCDCRDCRAERNAFERQEEARQAARREAARREAARKRAWAEERQKAEADLDSARQRAREARKETEGASGAATATPRPTIQKAEQLRQRGNKAFAEGKYARAVSQYSAALKEMLPARDGKVLSNRSAAYVKLERYDMAIKDAEECAALCPAWDKPLARRAMALSGLGKHLEAADAFEAAAAKCTDGPDVSRAPQASSGISAGGSKAKAEYVRLAVAQREAHADIAAKAEEARRVKAEEAERRRLESLQREAEAERARAEVAFELREAVAAGDEAALERCLASAYRHGVSKPDVAAAKAMLKKLASAREAEQAAARDQEAAEAVATELSTLLDDPSATRSGLKSALRRAEAAGVERIDSGSVLLARARERLGAKAAGAKEAKEKKDAEDRAAAAAAAAAVAEAARAEAAQVEARAREVQAAQQRAEAHKNAKARHDSKSTSGSRLPAMAAMTAGDGLEGGHGGRLHRLFESGAAGAPADSSRSREDDEAREREDLELALALSLQEQQLEAEAILNPAPPTEESSAATATLAADVERQRQEMQWQWRQQAAMAARGADAPPTPDGTHTSHPLPQSPHLHPQPLHAPPQSPHPHLQPPHPQLARMAPPPRQPLHMPQRAPPAPAQQPAQQTQQRQRTRPTHELPPPPPQYGHPPALAADRVGSSGRPAQPPLHGRMPQQQRPAPPAMPNQHSQPAAGAVAQATPPTRAQRAPGMPPHPSMLPPPEGLGGLSHNPAPTLTTDPWANQPRGQLTGGTAAALWHPLGIGAPPLTATALGGADPWGGAGVFSAAVPGRLGRPPQHEAQPPQPSQQGSYGSAPFDMSQLRRLQTSGFDSNGVWR